MSAILISISPTPDKSIIGSLCGDCSCCEAKAVAPQQVGIPKGNEPASYTVDITETNNPDGSTTVTEERQVYLMLAF